MHFSACFYLKKRIHVPPTLRSALSRAAFSSIAVFVLAACSLAATPQMPSGYPVSTTSVVKEDASPSAPIYALAARDSKDGYSKPEIIVYGAPSASGPVVIPLTGLYAPFPIAIDAQQTIYVADYGKDGDKHLDTSVTEWNAKHSGPIRTVTAGIAYPIAIAVTSAGRLYVANNFGGKAGTVTVYAKHAVKPLRTITKGVEAPSAVRVDASGYVYVANPGSLCPGGGSVAEYPPHAGGPAVVIKGLCQPSQLVIDSSDDLYVNGSDYANDVGEYAPHSTTVLRTLSLPSPWNVSAITLDPLGDLYVAAHENIGSDFFGKIFEYGPTGTKPKRTISLGRNVSPSLATDRYANLYAIVGPWTSMRDANDYNLECSQRDSECSLVEFVTGQKGRVVITKSNKTTVITGPIAVAP